jgi:hypothetical protein
LANQWRHAYGQACAHKRKAANNEWNI